MSRLTERNDFGQAYFPHCFKKTTCNGEGCSEKCNDCDFNSKITETIAKLEDAEEQGLLLKLPCKVGDTVYVLRYGEDKLFIIVETKIMEICQNKFGTFFKPLISRPAYLLDDFGKIVFLEKKDAEQALKKLKGGEE